MSTITFQPRIYALQQYLHRSVFFHGEIERLFGYDLAYSSEKFTLPSGKTECIASLGDDNYPCFLYYWEDELDTPFPHGLVVLQSDTDSNDYAQKAMSEKYITI